MTKKLIPYRPLSKSLLLINIVVALVYFSWWLGPNRTDNYYLFSLLLFGEIYHVFMALTFWFTVWPRPSVRSQSPPGYFYPKVDAFITVAGEPEEVVAKTVAAVLKMDYPFLKVYVLNDGFVAGKDNWRQIEIMAKKLGAHCITRTVKGGAKAGNVNHALKKTKGELVAIFDADMVPDRNFLQKTIPYFSNPKMGFVQTPQYYQNYRLNAVTAGSWDQQKFFFGPILRGKNTTNSAFICGTNVVIRRRALLAVGGMVENNIAEDFLTSLHIHEQGWLSHYYPKVLVSGLAPMDLLSYHKQQFRWARGSLQVLFGDNPFFKKGLTWSQKIQYLSSALYYFSGVIIAIDILMPLVYLFTGIQPVSAATTSFAIYFIPFMFLNLYTLNLASGADISFNTFSFSYSSWYLQLVAIFSILSKQNVGFSVTPKQAQSGNFSHLATPHLVYILMALIASGVALRREQLNPSVVTNITWALFNVILFIPYILVALNFHPKPLTISKPELALEGES